MLMFREKIVVCSVNHSKPQNTLCGGNVDLFNVKAGGKYNYQCALKSQNNFGFHTNRCQ
jgi:hypothetical protein